MNEMNEMKKGKIIEFKILRKKNYKKKKILLFFAKVSISKIKHSIYLSLIVHSIRNYKLKVRKKKEV